MRAKAPLLPGLRDILLIRRRQLDFTAFLQIGRGGEHDGFAAVQAVIEFDCRAEVAIDGDGLEMDSLVIVDDRDPQALLVEDQGLRRDNDVRMLAGNGKVTLTNIPARSAWAE